MEIIQPSKFIDIAINNKWLSVITLLMIRQVISDMQEDPDLEVSLNLHEQDWNDDRVIAMLQSIPEELRKRMDLEILETASFNRADDIKRIHEFRRLGYGIAVDDYGQDRSNLKKIIDIGPNKIKIDRDIVTALVYATDPKNELKNLENGARKHRAIAAIKHTVEFAREIGAQVTAEYVESQELFDILLEL